MRSLGRKPLNKYRHAKKFRHNVQKTKSANVRSTPMRGGFRM